VSVKFNVKPGLLCPVASYDFFRQREQLEQPVYARARGLANASFRWIINGVEVSVRNNWTNVNVKAPVTVRNPDNTTTMVAPSVTIQYGILDSWNGSVLYIKTLTTNGNFQLQIMATAREAVINDAEVSSTADVDLRTISWAPSDKLREASKRCNPFYAKIDATLWGLSARLSDLKNRPDPPAERTIKQIADSIHELDVAVSQYAEAGGMTVREVWTQIGAPGGLRSANALAKDVDLTRLRLSDAPANQTEQNSMTEQPLRSRLPDETSGD
jgi:hypothetical protein